MLVGAGVGCGATVGVGVTVESAVEQAKEAAARMMKGLGFGVRNLTKVRPSLLLLLSLSLSSPCPTPFLSLSAHTKLRDLPVYLIYPPAPTGSDQQRQLSASGIHACHSDSPAKAE